MQLCMVVSENNWFYAVVYSCAVVALVVCSYTHCQPLNRKEFVDS